MVPNRCGEKGEIIRADAGFFQVCLLWPRVQLKVLVRKPPPFALSLSKGHLKRRSWFDKLSRTENFPNTFICTRAGTPTAAR